MILLFIIGLVAGALAGMLFTSMVRTKDIQDQLEEAYWNGYERGQNERK